MANDATPPCPGRDLVDVPELLRAASRHGLLVTPNLISHSITIRDLEPATRKPLPLRFTKDEANRWLTDIARRQRVRLPRPT